MQQTKTRHYEITTKVPLKFIEIAMSSDKKRFDIKYSFYDESYQVPVTIDQDELEVTYCRVSNDKSTLFVDVTYTLHPNSREQNITIDFHKLLKYDLPHLKNGRGNWS